MKIFVSLKKINIANVNVMRLSNFSKGSSDIKGCLLYNNKKKFSTRADEKSSVNDDYPETKFKNISGLYKPDIKRRTPKHEQFYGKKYYPITITILLKLISNITCHIFIHLHRFTNFKTKAKE